MKVRRKKLALAMSGALVMGLFGIVSAHADWPGDCASSQHQHQLTSGNDVATYFNQDQCVDALGGDDNVQVADGVNSVWGDGGDDYIHGYGGDSTSTYIFKGGAGNDNLYGSPGPDTLIGGSGTDTFHDGSNPAGLGDSIYGTSGAGDTLFHCTGPGSHSDSDYIDPSVDNVLNSPNYC